MARAVLMFNHAYLWCLDEWGVLSWTEMKLFSLVGWKKNDLIVELTYGKWNNIFNKFTVLSNGFSWKQMYENKELKENRNGLWKMASWDLFIYFYFF